MDYLKETIYAGETPVGIINDYINLNEAETAARIYQRINRNRVGKKIPLSECTEYAQKLRKGELGRYIVEDVQNNLPAWNESKFLPPARINHILDNHTIKGRIDDLLQSHKSSIIKAFRYSDADFNKLKHSIIYKMRADKSLTEEEGKIVDRLKLWERKDWWPIIMNKQQIIKAIREAFEYAAKINRRQFPSTHPEYPDSGPSEKGTLKYQGQTKAGIVVHFYFNFDELEIETAYPIINNPGSIRTDKVPR